MGVCVQTRSRERESPLLVTVLLTPSLTHCLTNSLSHSLSHLLPPSLCLSISLLLFFLLMAMSTESKHLGNPEKLAKTGIKWDVWNT